MSNGDKRTVATDALETLGTIIDETAGRDAIHLAVEPIVAGQPLRPGDDVGIVDGLAVMCSNPVGIVDPFLATKVFTGQRFWLVIYPRQITSLRHVWTHSAFPPVEIEKEVAIALARSREESLAEENQDLKKRVAKLELEKESLEDDDGCKSMGCHG